MGSIRRTCRNVKRWRNAAMALRWTAAGMIEAAKGFRKLKAHKPTARTPRDPRRTQAQPPPQCRSCSTRKGRIVRIKATYLAELQLRPGHPQAAA